MTRIFKVNLKYFVRNNMKQPVKLFRVFAMLSTDSKSRKMKEYFSVLQKRKTDKEIKTNNDDVQRFSQSKKLFWVVSAPRDVDKELQEIRADVSWLYYLPRYRLLTLFTFFWQEKEFKIVEESDLLQECKEIILLRIR